MVTTYNGGNGGSEVQPLFTRVLDQGGRACEFRSVGPREGANKFVSKCEEHPSIIDPEEPNNVKSIIVHRLLPLSENHAIGQTASSHAGWMRTRLATHLIHEDHSPKRDSGGISLSPSETKRTQFKCRTLHRSLQLAYRPIATSDKTGSLLLCRTLHIEFSPAPVPTKSQNCVGSPVVLVIPVKRIIPPRPVRLLQF